MKLKSYIIWAASLCLLGKANAEVEEFMDLTFATYGDRELKLDLFKPKGATEKLPAIVCIHGGGWKSGEKIHFRKQARYLAAQNYVTVSIDYRLSGEAPFPVQIMDCKAAVRWLRANAETYGVDPDRIGATGHSAGGHLAALLATSDGVEELEGDGGNADFSSTIQAAVPMGAQTDLETDRIRSMTAQSGAAIWHDFLKGPLSENEELYQLASPRRHLDAGDPPMMFITGGLDNLDTQAVPIRGDMKRLEITSGLLVIPGAPHPFFSSKGEKWWSDLALQTTVFFFDKEFKSAGQ